MLQELADETENMKVARWTTRIKGDGWKRHTNICKKKTDRERWKLHLTGAEILHQRPKKRQRDSQKNPSRMHRDIFNGNIGTSLKRKVYKSTKMEMSMLNITHRYRKANIWVREKTKVTNVIEQVRRRKWTWTGPVSRTRDNRSTLRINTWKPYDRK